MDNNDMSLDVRRFRQFEKDMEDIEMLEQFIEINPLNVAKLSLYVSSNNYTCKRFNPFEDLTEIQFRKKYHFSKENFNKIIELLRDDMEADYNNKLYHNQVPIDIQIMIAIRCWAMTDRFETIAIIHKISMKTLYKIFKRVATVLSSNASCYIRMPATLAEKERVTNEFRELAGMTNVIGVVANFNVILKEKTDDERLCDGLINTQIVCDASLKIRDVSCIFESSKTSTALKTFVKSRIKERFEQNEFRGRILLGDNHLSSTAYLHTPHANPKTKVEHIFNQTHLTTYSQSSKCLSLLKKRFRIFDNEMSTTYNVSKNAIISMILLHNLALEWQDPCIVLEN